MEITSSTPDMKLTHKLRKGATVRGILTRLVINAVPAFVLFLVCKNLLHTSDLAAVLISGVPAAIISIIGIIRKGSMDLISAITLIVIATGIILPLLSGNPRLYFLRHSVITFVLGVAYMVSLLFPKPLWFYIGRYFLTGEDAYNMAQFNAQWRYPYFRTAMRRMTLFWGAFSLLFLVIYVPLVFTLPLALLVLVQSIAGTAFWLILLGWTGFYIRRITKCLNEIKKNEP